MGNNKQGVAKIYGAKRRMRCAIRRGDKTKGSRKMVSRIKNSKMKKRGVFVLSVFLIVALIAPQAVIGLDNDKSAAAPPAAAAPSEETTEPFTAAAPDGAAALSDSSSTADTPTSDETALSDSSSTSDSASPDSASQEYNPINGTGGGGAK
jgi:hypothetical protein